MEDREKKAVAAALLILAGGIVGAGVALLLAPQSGQRTRKDIARYARKTKNRANDVVDDLSATVSDLVNHAALAAYGALKNGPSKNGRGQRVIRVTGVRSVVMRVSMIVAVMGAIGLLIGVVMH